MKVYKHSDYDYVNIVEISKNEIKKIDFAMCQQPKEKLKSFYDRQEDKPDVLCNAGFFATSTGDTCFNVVDDGVVYSENTKYKWGMGITKEHKELKYGCISMPSYGFVDFVSGYPNLVDSGNSCAPWTFATEINYKALRTMIGYNDDTIFVVTVNSPGMTFSTMANLMINIGCKFAINLDGGGSSRCLVGGSVINDPSEDRAVDSVFCIYLTDEARKDFYGDIDNEKDYYIYTTVKGDSWWKISVNELGNGFLYTKLQEYNDWDPNKSLGIGIEIKIPNNKFREDDEDQSEPSEDSPQQPEESTETPDESNDNSIEISEEEKLIGKLYVKGHDIIVKDPDDNVLGTVSSICKLL